jgi:methyl-accepting chemotaxis protein
VSCVVGHPTKAKISKEFFMPENIKEKPKQFQRKTILIKRKLQFRYMLLIFLSVLIAFLMVGLDIIWTVSKVVSEHPMMQPLIDDMFSMAPLFLIKMLMYMVIVLIVSAVVSHRLAGPIYKFEKSVNVIASGDLTHRVVLRKGDQMSELQNGFNDMVQSLQSAIKNDKSIAETMRKDLHDMASKTDSVDVQEKLGKLSGKISGLFSYFKV